jgi:hypothetical protein
MCIKLHAELHLNKVQPRLEAAAFIEGQDYNKEFVKNALGPLVYSTLERVINDLIMNVDQTIETSIEVKDKFRGVLKSIFPNRTFIGFDLIDKRD